MADLDLAYMPAAEIAERVANKEISPVEVVDNSLQRIAEVNPSLNCFCFIWEDEARAGGRQAERGISSKELLGPLHGVPVALKDTTPTRGHRTTLGSYTHERWIPDHDAFIVEALRKAGAIILGKTTTPEFAHTLVTDSPLWGPTRNPWNLERTPGGSSGGSGAAVASGCVPLAEGSDMGGSIRIPASWCGVAGLKPGFGRIPMDTLPGLFDTISHLGPLARSVDDVRLFLLATQGPDDADIFSVPCPLDLRQPIEPDVKGLRLGLSIDLGCWAVDPAVERAVRKAASALEAAGATIDEVNPKITARDEEVWTELWSVFMAGYYGHLVDRYRDKMDPDVLKLIERGNRMTAVQLKRLELERTDLWRRISSILSEHDALLSPTMSQGPEPARKADRRRVEYSDGRYHSSDMTGAFNLVAPCPALSVPCGFDDDELPVGLQIVGRRWREDVVLRIGRAVELALPNSRRRPPI